MRGDDEPVTRAGFVDLGTLKGKKGYQNYEVPGGVDLNRSHAVTIWWPRFGVNFTTAALQLEREI
ncbi:MAG TPA: DM13 domain-containing protein [Alphaproteobacteria bacterium]|nr:DM13 domain-containing protein [Alphaproteobacteria bacterium]